MTPALLARLQELAATLTAEKDPDYKDNWERGHDAGMIAAGRLLQDILSAPEAAATKAGA
ncbi:hypothetical protein [Arthrobacter sp. IK3]|uniref:hypothetical protein n=1 Tax=Arthrobacter sp. IK3 TaxID=3448169 RepID=UPI003EDF3EBF